MNNSMYISLDKKNFEKYKTKFEEESDELNNYTISHLGHFNDKQIQFKPYDYSIQFDFDEETITLGGDITLDGKEYIGYTSITMKIDIDIMSEIVNKYIKKLNKLKTVLEATK